MSAILKFDFQKKKTITFFRSKLSQLHKKDPILHVTTTFSLKQGETRTSSGPNPHPLNVNSRTCKESTFINLAVVSPLGQTNGLYVSYTPEIKQLQILLL